MVIDVHAHIFPDALATRAVPLLAERSGLTPYTDGTCAGLLQSMRRAGIDRACVMPIATKPSQVRSINRWARELNQQHPEIVCFGTIHPDYPDWQKEIRALVSAGIQGVKLHPDYQEFFVDAPELTPIYQALAEAGLITLFHAGLDAGLPDPVHCTPDRLARVLDAVPELTVAAAHMGGYTYWDDVRRFLVGRNLYLDTSFSLEGLGAKGMVEMIRAHGADRVLFGTDSPWRDAAVDLAGIRALPLTPDEMRAVLGENTARLLKNHR